MRKYQNFSHLPVWINTRKLISIFYKKIKNNAILNKEYWIKDQLLRANLSILNNIAEGYDSSRNKEQVRFYEYAKRSASEVESMLYVLFDLDFLDENELDQYKLDLEEIRKQLSGLIRYNKSFT